MNSRKDDFSIVASSTENGTISSGKSSPAHIQPHGTPEIVGASREEEYQQDGGDVDAVDESKKGHFAYFKTKEFYYVMLLGYVQLLDMR